MLYNLAVQLYRYAIKITFRVMNSIILWMLCYSECINKFIQIDNIHIHINWTLKKERISPDQNIRAIIRKTHDTFAIFMPHSSINQAPHRQTTRCTAVHKKRNLYVKLADMSLYHKVGKNCNVSSHWVKTV